MLKKYLFIIAFILSLNSFGEIRYIRAMLYGNASNSITIGWDQFSGENPIFFLKSTDLEGFKQIANVKEDNFYKGMHNYFIRLTTLVPNKKYEFKIIDSEGSSEVYSFVTCSDKIDSISFIAGGDSRTKRTPRRRANLMVSKLRPDAVLFNGDMTSQDTEKEWKDWLEDWQLTSFNNHLIPIVAGRGNHEKSNKTLTKIFAIPSKKVFYSVQFGNEFINLITLNSEIWKSGIQKWFLKKSLNNHQNFIWQIPQYHKPVRPHVKHKREMNNIKRHFVPLFQKYKVKLVLECDSHTCKTTYPIVLCKSKDSEEGFVRDDKNGIVYIGEGCWGAPLRQPNDKKSWTRDAEAINSFKWIFVFNDKIQVKTVKYDNVIDVNRITNKFEMPKNIEIWNPINGGGDFEIRKR